MNTFKNILRVTFSNIIGILSGVAVGFIVPKIFSIEDYGYYKTFTLYVSYLGLFHLGLIDGIVLKFGAKDYEELPRTSFRSYFKWYVIINSIFAFIIVCMSIFFEYHYRIIAIFLAFDLIALNITVYFQQISQITQRFKEYSARKILQSICNFGIVVILIILYLNKGEVSYSLYGILIVLESCCFALWYIISYKDIIFGKSASILETKADIFVLIKTGFPLLFANLCSTLILNLDRQFVNILFTNAEYAVYAFSYSMLSLVTVATSAISTVLYPYLKRMDLKLFKHRYDDFIGIMSVVVFGIIVVYFPLCVFVNWFLPKYNDSLQYFRIILPGIAISSPITVVMHNYYKTLQINILYFKRSIVTLVFSGIANLIAYFIFGTREAISVASIITIILWYLYVNRGLKDYCNVNTKKNFAYIVLMLSSFYLTTWINNYFIAGTIYVLIYFFITYIFYRKLKPTVMMILRSKKNS